MDLINRKIYLENSISRNSDSTYGTLTATSFYFKVLLTQNVNDMGIFTDTPYIVQTNSVLNPIDYTVLINKLVPSGITFPFMSGGTPISAVTIDSSYCLRLPSYTEVIFYNYGFGLVSGYTDSKIDSVKTYSNINPYVPNFYINSKIYNDYLNTVIIGGDVVTVIGEPNIYTFDVDKNDPNSGTTSQNNGILYKDFSGITRNVNGKTINTTSFSVNGQGWNPTNTSLSALTKMEYLFGITTTPTVESDLFVDRGNTTVMENHLRLSEINSLNDLENYGNGFYNISRL